MKTKTRNFLIGFGSILDIMPHREPVDLTKTIRILTPEQLNAKAWEMVGESFRMAMGNVDVATKKTGQSRYKKWQP
jgi:hypothetical protein